MRPIATSTASSTTSNVSYYTRPRRTTCRTVWGIPNCMRVGRHLRCRQRVRFRAARCSQRVPIQPSGLVRQPVGARPAHVVLTSNYPTSEVREIECGGPVAYSVSRGDLRKQVCICGPAHGLPVAEKPSSRFRRSGKWHDHSRMESDADPELLERHFLRGRSARVYDRDEIGVWYCVRPR